MEAEAVPSAGAPSAPADAFDTLPCGVLAFREDGTILSANAGLLAMLGRDRAAVVGGHVETLFGVAGRLFFQTHLFPLLAMHGRVDEAFVLLRPAAGADVGVLLNAVRRAGASPAVFDCVLLEVKERRKFEEELLQARRTAEEARAAAERDARALAEANELLEQQAVELELQQHELAEQRTELELQSEELRRTNDELMLHGEELDRQRALADRANQAKSEFLAVMSHELRTPLNAIGGYSQLLELGVHGPVTEAQRETLGRIERAQRHLLRLINEVLNLSRIEAGHVEYTLEDVSLAELVRTVLPLVEPQAAEKGLSIVVDVDPTLAAHADREKVQQIVINLLTNAVKFTPGGGRITIDAPWKDPTSEFAYLRVRDTGVGIPRDKLDAVFEPFVQVDASRTRRAEGTGLGLAISRDLARGMRGDLRARSTMGEGSSFTLVLPRSRSAPPP